jgi:hypothetical protein
VSAVSAHDIKSRRRTRSYARFGVMKELVRVSASAAGAWMGSIVASYSMGSTRRGRIGAWAVGLLLYPDHDRHYQGAVDLPFGELELYHY